LKLKSVLLTIFLLGCAFLVITGASDYAKTRIRLHQENAKNKELKALGFDPDGTADELNIKMAWSAALVVAGGLGLFLFLYRSTRNNRLNSYLNKKNKSTQV